MTIHPRTTIRHTVANTLSNLEMTGSRVFKSKQNTWERDQLPGISIYTDSELVSYEDAERSQQRTLTLLVDCVAADSGDMEDTLDEISRQVEVAIAGDRGLTTMVFNITLAK